MLVGMVLWEEVHRKRSQALIPSLCGILVYNDETSSVTSKELAGKLPMVRSLLRKSMVMMGMTSSIYFFCRLMKKKLGDSKTKHIEFGHVIKCKVD